MRHIGLNDNPVPGTDWPVGYSGKFPNGWFHEVEKTLNYGYGELHRVYMKKMILKLWIFQKSVSFFNSSTHLHLLGIY